jgi:phage major head subunit gpT-like protein
MGAFDDLRNVIGRGAALKFNNVFWAAFINNASLFPTNNSNTNYISGSGTALGTDGAGLGAGVTAFRKMTSPTADGSKRIGVGGTPTILLVPPELESTAELLYQSRNLLMVKAGDANIYAGRYRPVIQNRLSDSAFSGYSTTAWYLLGDPSRYAAMHVAFLNGVETPTVESADADFDQLGILLRGYHDFGVTLAEKACGIKSKGAS